MLRFPLAILVVFVHGFGADIDVSELHASGLTGLAVYDCKHPTPILAV